MSNKVYNIITERFIEALERGRVPWNKPWSTAGILPANGFTGRQYSGVNILLLGMMPFEQPYWLTYNQAKKAGGNVKKGESSTPVTFWKMSFRDRETGDYLKPKKAREWQKDETKKARVQTIPLLRYYNVFNIDQCENLDEDKIKRADVETFEWDSIKRAEEIWENFEAKPELKHGGGRAFYRPLDDLIKMPKGEHFKTAEGYHKTLFHEAIHSTGHETRLDRNLSAFDMKKKSYSKEELTAEIGAAFLSHAAGFLDDTFDNSAAYVNGWLEKLKDEDNETMIVHAAARAQKAADMILNRND